MTEISKDTAAKIMRALAARELRVRVVTSGFTDDMMPLADQLGAEHARLGAPLTFAELKRRVPALAEATHFVVNGPGATYVKEAGFFVTQGGLRESWGERWVPVAAKSIEAALKIGEAMR